MRTPAGAPVPLRLTIRKKLLPFVKFTKPSLGTVAVIGTIILTSTAVFAVAIYPMIEKDYYKNAQAEQRALLRGTREDHAHGLRVVELNHTRADHIPDLSRFNCLKVCGSHVYYAGLLMFLLCSEELALRTNLLKSMDANLRPLVNLTELDLYENQIDVISNLDTLTNLKKLDLSFNRIREITGLTALKKLTYLYLVHNKITEIKGLENLLELELLELGDNRIGNIGNVSHLKKLRELYIGKNKIVKIEGLENLKDLRLLSMPANRLTNIENLDALTNLEEIYLSDQGIKDITSLAVLKKLRTIDVSNNDITSFDGISELKELTDFWANDNRISNWAEIDKLRGLDKLDTVYLERNPIYDSDRVGYRRKIMLALQQVKQIDATMCR
ncbi:leucine Rich repeat-containing domain protein [Dictyocaulus viviparus]|uniref:Leucine Rich repeat-containing domain protein n=1 Tax=Dictyocaulus viviparus TaxID=29172 RepID=A0A0D8XLK4_DICVI|nr:leucine Rich repeat-containing domain protein [Dictyocaulus viviparus]